jgi:hypothetical protein
MGSSLTARFQALLPGLLEQLIAVQRDNDGEKPHRQMNFIALQHSNLVTFKADG